MKKLLTFVLTLSLATAVFAGEKLKIRKFKGLNTRLSDYEIANEESPDMTNFDLDKAGVLSERDLFVQYNTSSAGNFPITDVYKFYKSSDAGYLLCVGNGVIYHATGGQLNQVLVSSDSVEPTSQWGFETFTDGTSDLIFAANQANSLRTWNGSDTWFSVSASSPAENCRILKKHKSRLFASGSSEYPYRVYYSSLTDGDDWTTSGGTLDLPTFEKIMGLEVLSDVLYIFTRQSIYALLGSTPNEFQIVRTLSNVGTHATESVVLGNNVIFFLNKAGVFAFDGRQSLNISETIIPTIDTISSTYLDRTSCEYDKRGRLLITYTPEEETYNTKVLVYDTVLKEWYKLSGNFSSFFKAEGGTDKGELYAGTSDSTGYLWQLQAEVVDEQLVHSSESQLATGVTHNTTLFWGTEADPIVAFETSEYKVEPKTKLLLHCAENGGNTSTIDSVSPPHTVVFNDNAKISSDAKFQNGSILFDGVGDYVTIADLTGSDFDIMASATDDWTIEYWAKHDTSAVTQFAITQWTAGNNGWWTYHTSGKTIVFSINEGGTPRVNLGGGWGSHDSEWHHVAIIKVGSSWGLYIDGEQIDYDSNTNTVTFAAGLNLGREPDPSDYFAGRLDEIRIQNSNYFDANPDSYNSDRIIPCGRLTSGTLSSENLRINAAGQASLGEITWNDSVPEYTDIQFTTRTGTTDDTTYDTWTETWVSTNSVSIDSVTDATVWTTYSNANFITVTPPWGPQPRDIDNYESENTVSAACVQFEIQGVTASDIYCSRMIPGHYGSVGKDLSNSSFIAYWLKSDVTGPNVELAIAEVTETDVNWTDDIPYCTATTVEANVWEKHYWPLSSYTSTDIDNIRYLRVTWRGNEAARVYLGDIWAYDFYDSGETIISTPNDYIQYKAILGSLLTDTTPQLVNENQYVVKLSFAGTVGSTESSLTSTWKSKRFDFENEYNKYWRFVELDLEATGGAYNETVYLGYDLNDGEREGCLTNTYDVSGRRVKMRFYFPSGTTSRNIQLTVSDNTVDNSLQIHNLILDFSQGGY